MILAIDAFNLIYKLDGLDEHMFRGELAEAMQGLRKRLKEYQTNTKGQHQIHVFFDGKRRHGDETRRSKDEGLYLYYSQDLSADHLIKEFINRSAHPGTIWVVSSDKAIRMHAKSHRCHLFDSDEFALLLQENSPSRVQANEEEQLPPEKTRPLDDQEIAYWAEMFKKRGPRH